MKILHVISQRPDSTGSGIYLQAMLKEAARNNHTNYVVAGINSKSSTPIPHLLCSDLQTVDFETDELSFPLPGMSDIMPYTSSKFIDLSPTQIQQYENAFATTIDAILKTNGIDLIHCHHLWILASLVKRNFPNLPLVASCHGSDLRQFKSCKHLQQRVLSGCCKIDTVLALTKQQKTEISTLYKIDPKRIHVVGAGYDAKVFYPLEKPKLNPFTLVYCGKISRAKGVPWLLQSFQQLQDPNLQLHLIGSGTGEEYEECMQLVKNLGERVVSHGKVSQDQFATLLQQSHVFILPSLYEGLPLVILEALACNCHVVATSLPGCIEIVEKIGDTHVTLVPLPKITGIETISQEEQAKFVLNLKKTLENTISVLRKKTAKTECFSQVEQYHWQNIYSQIDQYYMQHFS